MAVDNVTQPAGLHPPIVFSEQFPGRALCVMCGLPYVPNEAGGVCMSCKELAERTASALVTGEHPSSWRNALAAARRKGRPFMLDVAERVMDQLGGPEQLADRLVQDFKSARGEHLTPEQAMFQSVDLKLVTKLYEMLQGFLESRDKLVGDTDPLGEMSEEQLMAVASQAALLRLEHDALFRDEILCKISDTHPHEIVSAALTVLSPSRVTVIDAQKPSHPVT